MKLQVFKNWKRNLLPIIYFEVDLTPFPTWHLTFWDVLGNSPFIKNKAIPWLLFPFIFFSPLCSISHYAARCSSSCGFSWFWRPHLSLEYIIIYHVTEPVKRHFKTVNFIEMWLRAFCSVFPACFQHSCPLDHSWAPRSCYFHWGETYFRQSAVVLFSLQSLSLSIGSTPPFRPGNPFTSPSPPCLPPFKKNPEFSAGEGKCQMLVGPRKAQSQNCCTWEGLASHRWGDSQRRRLWNLHSDELNTRWGSWSPAASGPLRFRMWKEGQRQSTSTNQRREWSKRGPWELVIPAFNMSRIWIIHILKWRSITQL